MKLPIQLTNKETELKWNHKDKSLYCVCKLFGPIFTFIRIFGAFPITWSHSEGICVYRKSYFWLLYSGLVLMAEICLILINVNYETILNAKLLTILDNLTHLIYSHYVILIMVIGIWKYPVYIETLNRFVSTIKNGVFCQSAMRKAFSIQFIIFAFFLLIIVLEICILIWLNLTHRAHFTFLNIIYRMFANFTFGLYSAVFVIVAVLMGCLGCFEKFALNSLRFVPIHPLKEIDETNNLRDLMGLMQYELCSEKHLIRDDLATQKASRTVEILRINHEEICVSIYDFNKCLDITFLFNTIVELGILIVDWYAVIAYLVYSFQEDEAFGLNILNIFFVLFHTYALFLFLKTFQQLKNMIHGLVTFLLEYSTRIYEPEEHQQVRLFIEKINNHRPFTACGVFTIDLGIAGPIAANILTYVLVALQFEVPDDE